MAETPNILIADDDPILRETLHGHLSDQGYDVIAAADGEKALAHLKGKRFHLVIIDIKMPKVDGFQLLEYVKENLPSTKAIMLTGYADLKNVEKCRKLGADDVIAKPYDLGDLLDAISLVMKK